MAGALHRYAPRKTGSAKGPVDRNVEMTFGAIMVMIVAVFFLSRIGYVAEFPLPIALAVVPLVIAWMLAHKQAEISLGRLALFMVVLACAMMSLLLADPNSSQTSVQLFVLLYAMFIAPVSLDQASYIRYFRLIANVASILCILGAVQYLTQFIFLTEFHFSWRTIVPPDFLLEYNTLNETQWGSGIYKGNGFFLLEPSHLSQVGSRALLLAIFILKDPKYIVPIGLGLVTSYSGTGMVLVAFFGAIPFLALIFADNRYSRFAIAGVMLALAGAMIFWEQLNLGMLLGRTAEFSDPRSSGFARFTAGGLMFQNFIENKPLTLLFGAGPGMAEIYTQLDEVTEAFASAWIKLLVEYGILGFTAFSAFYLYCVYTTTRSAWLALAFYFQFMVLDGGLLVPQLAFAALMMGCLVRLKPAPQQTPPLPTGGGPSPSRAQPSQANPLTGS